MKNNAISVIQEAWIGRKVSSKSGEGDGRIKAIAISDEGFYSIFVVYENGGSAWEGVEEVTLLPITDVRVADYVC